MILKSAERFSVKIMRQTTTWSAMMVHSNLIAL